MPRNRRYDSNGLRTPPVALLTNCNSAASFSSLTTNMPPNVSECPPIHLVQECITISAPSNNGCWPSGVAKVLSTTTNTPSLWPIAASASISTTCNVGLTGDSSHNNLVSGFIAASTAARSEQSTKSVSKPCE